MKFIQTHLNMRMGRMEGESISGWQMGSVWWAVDGKNNYYATVINKRIQNQYDYWSVISQQLHPYYRLIDGNGDIFSTLKISAEVYNNYPVYESVSGESMIYYYATGIGMIAMRNNYFIGYIPDAINDEYWDVEHNYMYGYYGVSPLSSGTATAAGTATTSYIINAHWPRWELQGTYSAIGFGNYNPKPGLYQPCDGVSGQFKVGTYDTTLGQWVPDYGWTRNMYMGESVTWR